MPINAAAYNLGGTIVVSSTEMAKAQQAFQSWSAGTLGSMNKAARDRLLDGVCTLVHEELHSWMPGNPRQVYNGVGEVIEEVQVELLSRKAIRTTFASDFISPGAYNAYIQATAKEILSARGLAATPANIASVLDLMEDAASRVRAAGARFNTAADYLRGWIAEFRLNPAEAQALEAGMLSPGFTTAARATSPSPLPLDR
jgi:hypothetical protein